MQQKAHSKYFILLLYCIKMSTFRFFSAVCLIVVAFLLLETDASPKPNIKGKNRASSSGNAKPNAGRLTLQNQRDVDAHGTGKSDSTTPASPIKYTWKNKYGRLTLQNQWDVDARGTSVTLSDKFKDLQLIAEYTGPYKGHYPVLAKQPIPNGDVGIFYFEMKVISEFSHVYIGLGSKSMPLNQWPGRHVGTYAYGNREFWGHAVAESSSDPSTRRPYIGGKFSFEQDDVVGCGVNLKTSEIIYTLNGKPLTTTGLLVSSTAGLFPCVWMYCPGNKIEANFGPEFLCKDLGEIKTII